MTISSKMRTKQVLKLIPQKMHGTRLEFNLVLASEHHFLATKIIVGHFGKFRTAPVISDFMSKPNVDVPHFHTYEFQT